jgi:hypothetical protein
LTASLRGQPWHTAGAASTSAVSCPSVGAFGALEDARFPVIAAIQGGCTGGRLPAEGALQAGLVTTVLAGATAAMEQMALPQSATHHIDELAPVLDPWCAKAPAELAALAKVVPV